MFSRISNPVDFDSSNEDSSIESDLEIVSSSLGWQTVQKKKIHNGGRVIALFEVSNGDIWVAGGDKDWIVRVYGSDLQLKWELDLHTEEVNIILQHKSYLITAADDYTIIWYDIEQNYEHVSTLHDIDNEKIVALESYPEWRIVSGGIGPFIKFWDMLSWKWVKRVNRVTTGHLLNLLYLPDYKYLVALYQDSVMAFFDVSSDNIIMKHKVYPKNGPLFNYFYTSRFMRVRKYGQGHLVLGKIWLVRHETIFKIFSIDSFSVVKTFSMENILFDFHLHSNGFMTIICQNQLIEVYGAQLSKNTKLEVTVSRFDIPLKPQGFGYPHNGIIELRDGRLASGSVDGDIIIMSQH